MNHGIYHIQFLNGCIQVLVDPIKSPLLTSEDKLGWTFQSDAGPLCYSFSPQHSTLQYAWAEEDSGSPIVGRMYGFDKLQRPMEFSVAAMIVDGKYCMVLRYSGEFYRPLFIFWSAQWQKCIYYIAPASKCTHAHTHFINILWILRVCEVYQILWSVVRTHCENISHRG